MEGVVPQEISELHPQRDLFSLARAAGERGCGSQPTLLLARLGVWIQQSCEWCSYCVLHGAAASASC